MLENLNVTHCLGHSSATVRRPSTSRHKHHPYGGADPRIKRAADTLNHHTQDRPAKRPRIRVTPTSTPSLFRILESTDFAAQNTFGNPDGPDGPDGPAGPGGGDGPPPPPPPRITITYLKRHLNSLTHRARKGEYNELIGQESNLRKMMHAILSKKSIFLTGPSGRGKRTLVRMLARQLANGPIPPGCQNQYIMELNLDDLQRQPGWLDTFKQRVDEVLRLKTRVILSLPRITDLTHSMDGREAVSYLKQKIRQGLRIIATANSNNTMPLLGDCADEVLFMKISDGDKKDIQKTLKDQMLERKKKEAFDQLRKESDKVEARYDIRVEDEAIETAIECASDDLESFQIEEGALVREAGKWLQRSVTELLLRIQENPADYRTPDEPVPQVNTDLIYEVFSMWEGVPVDEIRKFSSGLRLKDPLNLEARLRLQVVGQDEAIECVSNSILTMVSGLKDETAPIGTFLFLGPTGVGKTELAKAVARELFGSENDMIRIDMSEYQEKHTVSRLIGSPPGYVGYDKGGQLTEAVRKKPYSVVLLDEIEKAHPDVLKVFLQVFDEGRLTDGKGKTVDFRNCLFILTSNLKSAEIGKMSSQGSTPEEILAFIQSFLMKTLSPELFNRLDAVIPFHHISEEILNTVCPMMLRRLGADVKDKLNITLTWTPEVLGYLGKHGYSPDLGLRPLKRLVTKSIRTLISRGVLTKQFGRGDTLELYVEGGVLHIRKVS